MTKVKRSKVTPLRGNNWYAIEVETWLSLRGFYTPSANIYKYYKNY